VHDTELATLLVSRVCHDLIGPVGAIVNGMEMLEDEDDGEMREHALALIASSARSATAKLEFCRMAYGASGAMEAMIDPAEARDAVNDLIGKGRISLVFEAASAPIPKAQVKLLACLMLSGVEAIPRGGVVTARVREDGDMRLIDISAEGGKVQVAPEVLSALKGESALSDAGHRHIHAFFTGLLIRAAEGALDATVTETSARLTVRLKAAG